MLDFRWPIMEFPAGTAALFTYLRKIGARTVGDAYRAAGDSATPESLRKEILAHFGMEKFDPKLLPKKPAKKKVVVKTAEPVTQELRARKIRLDELDSSTLGYEVRRALERVYVQTLGDFQDIDPATLQGIDFPMEYLTTMNDILSDHGLPRKEVTGLKKRFD
jgi:hypothetical protein